jgi:hypothetical protein
LSYIKTISKISNKSYNSFFQLWIILKDKGQKPLT